MRSDNDILVRTNIGDGSSLSNMIQGESKIDGTSDPPEIPQSGTSNYTDASGADDHLAIEMPTTRYSDAPGDKIGLDHGSSNVPPNDEVQNLFAKPYRDEDPEQPDSDPSASATFHRHSSPPTYSRGSTLLIFFMGLSVGALVMVAVIFSNPTAVTQIDGSTIGYVQQTDEAPTDHIAYTDAEEKRTEDAEEKIAKELGIDKFCGHCKWRATSFTCDARVGFLMHRYGDTEIEAKKGILQDCMEP